MARLKLASCTLVLLLSCGYVHFVHCCIHDSIDHKYVSGAQNYNKDHPFLVSERRRRLGDRKRLSLQTSFANKELATVQYQPIRLTPYYDKGTLDKLPTTTRAEVVKIVTEAIQRISRALQVVPVSGNLFAHRFCTSTYDTTPPICHSISNNELCLEMPIPDDHFASIRYCDACSASGCNNCTISPAGTGIPDTDFLIYVRADNTNMCESGSTLAYASTCQQDQYDRPTFGMVNFCPNQLSTTSAAFERQVSTALHEFSHALGFSSRFFPLMRFEDGTPRTPRDQSGKPPTFTAGTCPNGKPIDYYAEPANTTVTFTTARNHVVAKMVTPRVRAFVREHFNCPTLEGAEIESQDGGCLGSHWEERLFEPEYMTPVDSYRNVFSALTLAFFADSGWYRVNSSTSEIMHFGRGKGCSFATEKCVNPATQTPLDTEHFCATPATTFQGCSVDATSRSTCSLSSTDQIIPAEYQYFPNNVKKGGVNRFADFCPLNVAYAKGDCSIASNLLKLGTTTINAYGETYCPTCKCTATSLRGIDSMNWNISPARQTGCYEMQCIFSSDARSNVSGTFVQIRVPRSNTEDSVDVNCTKKGETLAVPGFDGTITCPDPLVVCNFEDPSRVLTWGVNDSPTAGDIGSDSSQDFSASASIANSGSDSWTHDASFSYQDDTWSTSNSSNGTSSNAGTKVSAGTITTGATASGVCTYRWVSTWIVLSATWLSFAKIL
ncbi:unnamed protein product [Phytophthora lilii]|uniref:Unnamed protein product n=1 Tax=Phytophthora lilii TaxID=2077276 RepID=A0A9W6U228_9STRA|nr:unnamed protein product [Phytophthora lilii]